ncbi:hypothetical protein CDAR_510851 [Caerostris darwini]|uniref:Uncharacterized protein n=1 Tax=Caerostris darwini TaxID=1538125 RepID=A0AAV4TAV0_9ARAC|nr:hypothetical protein CDAR_510851 [Caerostris darwini]
MGIKVSEKERNAIVFVPVVARAASTRSTRAVANLCMAVGEREEDAADEARDSPANGEDAPARPVGRVGGRGHQERAPSVATDFTSLFLSLSLRHLKGFPREVIDDTARHHMARRCHLQSPF